MVACAVPDSRPKYGLHTRYWIDTAIAVQSTWSPLQLLILWRELSWRLQQCLQILPDSAVDIFRQLVYSSELGDIFKNTPSSPTGFFPKDDEWPADLCPDTHELRQDWIACLLEYLSACRIQPDIEKFDNLIDICTNLSNLTKDQQSDLAYQCCLQALAELDRERVAQFLDGWPTQPGDPYWLVRKASIHLELGDREMARSLASDALHRIREQPRGEDVDHWRLSREGWCLRFLYQLHESSWLSNPQLRKSSSRDISADRHDLDNELEAARCSPDTELRMLGERIRKRYPPLERPYTTTTAPNFDNGYTSDSHHIGEYQPIERVAPALTRLPQLAAKTRVTC